MREVKNQSVSFSNPLTCRPWKGKCLDRQVAESDPALSLGERELCDTLPREKEDISFYNILCQVWGMRRKANKRPYFRNDD